MRPPALARERRAGHRLGGHLGLHVERAAAPQEAVGDLARPRVVLPLVGVGEHGVDVAEEASVGPLPVPASVATGSAGPSSAASISVSKPAALR